MFTIKHPLFYFIINLLYADSLIINSVSSILVS